MPIDPFVVFLLGGLAGCLVTPTIFLVIAMLLTWWEETHAD